MKILTLFAALALCLVSCKKDETTTTTKTETESTVTTKEKDTAGTAAPEQPVDSIAEQKAWIAYATPGKEHKLLADENGNWTAEMIFWHAPDALPHKATTTANVKMLFDGKYQEANYKGDVMGMPFEGKSIISFDNTVKEYTSVWIDNMGTGMMVMKGKPSADNKTLNFTGEMVDPARGKKVPYREVYTIVDANTRKMEMFDTKNGREYKSMEIIMKRK